MVGAIGEQGKEKGAWFRFRHNKFAQRWAGLPHEVQRRLSHESRECKPAKLHFNMKQGKETVSIPAVAYHNSAAVYSVPSS